MQMTMDENGSNESAPSFQHLRARFEKQHSTSELDNVIKTKKFMVKTDHELSESAVDEWKKAATLKKCSSELIQTPNQCKPQIAKKPDFLKPQNGNNSSTSIQEIIERLNNANIPLAGSLMANRNGSPNESNAASTSELSEASDEQPVKFNTRSNSFMVYGAMPKQIIEEMRANGHFKKIPSIKSKLPKEIGQVRAQSTRRMFAQLPSSSKDKNQLDSWCSSAPISIYSKESQHSADSGSPPNYECQNKPVSIISSTGSDDTVFETYEYFGKDEAENRRLSELHGVVYEICCRQRTFLRLLTNIYEELIPFIQKIDEKSSHKAYSPPSHGMHVLDKLILQLQPIVQLHSALFDEFNKNFAHWSALTPDFAKIFVQHADFLKICSGFLKVKKSLTDELITAMEQNRYLAHAIRLFEDEVLNAPESGQSNSNGSNLSIPLSGGGISLIMHLDNVHQNVVRYILLMERYKKLLPPNIDECQVADKAINKLKAVSQTINCSLADPDYTNKLMEIHRKVQGAFDVLGPTRRLIHDGRLMKQTRKDLQERHLVLFSDQILICRYAFHWDYFEISKSFRIPIKNVQVQIEDHVDHECEFALINPNKSTIFVAKSKKERDLWVNLIEETRNKWLETERKLQDHQRKVSVAQPTIDAQLEDETPTDPNINFLTPKNPEKVNGNAEMTVPIWTPDSKVTKCMMAECGTKFNLIKRRHHCRNCGDIMCSNCMGKAPVRVKNYECENVCSECFDKILDEFVNLSYFPPKMIRMTDSNLVEKVRKVSSVHPKPDDEESKDFRSELISALKNNPFGDIIMIDYGTRSIHPRDCFKEPTNKHFHRTQPLNPTENARKSHEVTLLISGKVHLINQKKGQCQIRWARLDSDYSLNFFEAELDATAVDTFFLFGYSVFINDNLRDGQSGTEFTLLHQNQIKTERKDLRIVFRVENQTAADGWQDALLNKLELPTLNSNDISN